MYIPIIKLAESEIRALENINFEDKDIIPLIELTREKKKNYKIRQGAFRSNISL